MVVTKVIWKAEPRVASRAGKKADVMAEMKAAKTVVE